MGYDSPCRIVQERKNEIAGYATLGVPGKEIAEILGIHPATVNNHLKDPLVQARIDSHRANRDASTADVLETLQREAPRAMDLLQRAMNQGVITDVAGTPIPVEAKERLAIARDILDRAGHGKTTKVRTENLNLTVEDLILIKEVAETDYNERS